MIVVDANIIAYFFIPGEYSEIVEQVLRKDPKWVVPLLWRSEFCNILFKYIRFTKMDMGTAVKTAEAAQRFFSRGEFAVSFHKVLELASQTSCSAYDCEYAVLASDLRVPLLTTDKKILKAFPNISISCRDFLKTNGKI